MTAPAPSADTVTILRTVSPRLLMAKQFTIAANGQVVKRDYSNAATFRVEEAPAGGIGDLFRILQRVERDPSACVIRGKPIEGTNLAGTSRKKQENGGNFVDVLRHWVMLDLDRVTIPAATSVLEEPESVARLVVDLIASHVPELDGVSSVVHFSSSAGLGEMADAEVAAGMPPRWKGVAKASNVVGAHAWFWLAVPVTSAELDRWHHAVNAAAGHKFIDPVTLRTVQPHYTAAPVFGEGLRDPMPGCRTVLIEGEADTATLNIPPVAARKPYEPGQSNTDGRGYNGWLEAIGGLEGFHTPINRAIASFIATNWPSPDTEALKAALIARIHAADPGDRTPADIERYASETGLDARIAWTMGREQAKRDERAAADAEAAAQPIPPTYPDRGVPLAEASRQAGEALGGFADRIAAGETPYLLLQMTVGGGKTFSAIEALPQLLAAGREAERGPALFLHPRHALGDQIAADIRKAHPHLKVASYRGREADNPAAPGQKMCRDLELSNAAVAASMGATGACKACPIAQARLGCAYLGQAEVMRKADIIVAPHQVLFHTPFAGWPRMDRDGAKVPVPPSVIIVDEDITGSGLEGMGTPVQLALSALLSDTTPNLTGIKRDRLLNLRRNAHDALARQGNGALFREPVEWMGVEPPGELPPAREWAKLEWDCKPRVKLGEAPTRDSAMKLLGEAAASGFTRLRPLLGKMIAEFLESGDARSVNLRTNPEAELGRNQGTGPAVQFAYRMDFHEGWSGPTLFLDATGRAEVLRHWAPDLVEIAIEVAAPHQHVVQVVSHEFGRTMLTQPGNVSALVDLLLVEAAQADGATLAVMQQAVERLVRTQLEGRPEKDGKPAIKGRGAVRDPLAEGENEDSPATYRFPSGAVLHLAHHGAVTGSNAWQNVTTVVEVGRPAVDRFTGERMGEVIAGRAVGVVEDASDSWWPMTTAAVRMADGTGFAVARQPMHPDPLVEACRWRVTEGAVLQAIGRCRGVRRDASTPARVVVLAAMALPLTVAEVTAWDDFRPDRLTTAAAEAALFGRALPLAPADLSAARIDLWATPKAAERYLAERGGLKTPKPLIIDTYKGFGGFKALTGARYKKPGARRWSNALVPKARGREAMAEQSGPLADFELIGCSVLPLPAAAPSAPASTVRPDSSVNPGSERDIHPFPPSVADTVESRPPVLHPPLPGEDLQPPRPPPAQAGLLGVIPGRRTVPVDPYPEPGSYEVDAEDLQPVLPGTPLPAEAPRAWWFELQRRKAAVPLPDMSIGWPANHFREERWKAAVAAVEAAWDIEWQAAWIAGSRLPPADEGTTT